ncbi:MAG: phage tail tape measure C-terminal domain-containing protein, partial [Xanthobacteraceae bacterium]
LALKEKIAAINKDPKAAGLTDAEKTGLAKDQIAADARRSGEGKKVARTADSRFDQDIQGVKDRTAALIEEQKIVGLDTEKQEARRLALDLEQSALKRLREEARQKGVTDLDSIKLSDEQRAKIEAVAAAYGKQYAELEKLNGPLASFARQSADVGKALDASLANSLDRMADDLADVVMGTKSVGDAFKAMTDLILKEIIKIALKKAILGPIAGLLGNLIPGAGVGMPLNILPGRASGGPVTAGQPYIVGEKRPELFVPSQNGMIIPQVPTMKGRRGGNDFNVTISLAGANGDDAIRQIAAQATLQGSRAVLAQVPGMAVKAVGEHMRRAG